MVITQAMQNKVIKRLSTIETKVGLREIGVKPQVEKGNEEHSRMIQRRMDDFKLQITKQLKGVQTTDIIDVKVKIAELWKLVDKLHEWPVYPMLIIMNIQPKEEIKNIWDVRIEDEGRKKKENKKRKGLSIDEENIEVEKRASVQSEKNHEMKVQEMVVGASSSRPIDVADRGTNSASLPKPLLSTPTKNSSMISRMS